MSYIGEIRLVGFEFYPEGWYFCHGESLAINEHEDLYSLIGTTYGGDGIKTFNLPDLRSRLVVGSQNGLTAPGLTPYALGERAGVEEVKLTPAQVPVHAHGFSAQLAAATGGASTADPHGAYPAPSSTAPYLGAAGANQTLNANALSGQAQPTGGREAHANIQPVQALSYIICVRGQYPPLQ